MSVALILLAAGGSTRMGRAKQLLPYRGTTLLRHAATTALASQCHPVVVVVGCQASAMRSELAGLPVQIVENPDWLKGMGTSIRAGLNAILHDHSIPAVVIMLCDQPGVTVNLLNQLVECHVTRSSPIVACAYAGIAGVPALFDGMLFTELKTLDDSRGAGEKIQQYGSQVARIPFPEGAVDIDTAEDYQQL